MTRPFIEIREVCKSFDNGRSFAVRNATLQVEAGSLVAVLGSTGAGKSTLLKFVNRLIQPDSGDVTIDNVDVASVDAPILRRRIGYVSQGAGLFPHMSVAENIGITPKLLGWPPSDVARRVQDLLDMVELPQAYAARRPATLSGGERQRVAIARAIAARPNIVLMDEPFGALDPVTRDSLGSAYRTLHNRLKLTTIMVTHDVQEAVLLADRLVVMKAGHIIAHDTPHALLAASEDRDVAALMAMPKRWAERIRDIVENGKHP